MPDFIELKRPGRVLAKGGEGEGHGEGDRVLRDVEVLNDLQKYEPTVHKPLKSIKK